MADKWIKKWNVPGSNDHTWIVAVDKDGNYGCSCPVWKFKRMECKHIIYVKNGGGDILEGKKEEDNMVDLPKELIYKLKQLEILDKKQAEISFDINAIYQVSAVGQAPPIFHNKCEQLYNIATKKAKIWNYIRHFCIPGSNKTIWQKALGLPNLGYVFKNYGEEEGTCITAEVIKKQILEIKE